MTVVQAAFWRLLRARPGEIADERGWLIVVTSRLCLDQIRSARARRERPHDASEIEFVPGAQASAPGQESGDPADRVTLDDNVRLALLVVLRRLSPAERVVFVLHDIFQVPFGSIAQTVGRPEPSCRQLARHLLHYWGPGATLVTHPVAGQPALLGFVDRVLAGVLVFTMRDGKIQAVHVIGDPRQLAFVSSQLR